MWKEKDDQPQQQAKQSNLSGGQIVKPSPTPRGSEDWTRGPPRAPRAGPPSFPLLNRPVFTIFMFSCPTLVSPPLPISLGTPHLRQPHPLGHHRVTSTRDSSVSQDSSAPGAGGCTKLSCVAFLTQQCHPQERTLRKECEVHNDGHTRTPAAELFIH